jgi:hypothetical protein
VMLTQLGSGEDPMWICFSGGYMCGDSDHITRQEAREKHKGQAEAFITTNSECHENSHNPFLSSTCNDLKGLPLSPAS